MNILLVAAAFAASQAAPAAPVDHSQHNAAQHAQHQKSGEAKHDCEKCCKEVNGKTECQMMKGDAAKKGGETGHHQGHSGH